MFSPPVLLAPHSLFVEMSARKELSDPTRGKNSQIPRWALCQRTQKVAFKIRCTKTIGVQNATKVTTLNILPSTVSLLCSLKGTCFCRTAEVWLRISTWGPAQQLLVVFCRWQSAFKVHTLHWGQRTKNTGKNKNKKIIIDFLFFCHFWSFQEGFGGRDGFRNDPELSGSVLSWYEPIASHMHPFHISFWDFR